LGGSVGDGVDGEPDFGRGVAGLVWAASGSAAVVGAVGGTPVTSDFLDGVEAASAGSVLGSGSGVT
jgi:hypothetical protein